jgi:hypothetical protein
VIYGQDCFVPLEAGLAMTITKEGNFILKETQNVYIPLFAGLYKECIHEDGMQ